MAYSYAGGEEGPFFTLEQARKQVEIWEEKGYRSYVGKLSDPTWEDLPEPIPTIGEAKPFSPEVVFGIVGPNPEDVTQFAFKLLQLNGHELDYQDGGVMVYDPYDPDQD